MQSSKLAPFVVYYENSEEFHHLKGEVFTQGAYYFETDNPRPRIIDAGAHIGLATLYFKKIFPAAVITAIEPHPHNFKLLEKNIWENQLEDIEVVPAALAEQNGFSTLHADASNNEWWSTASFTPGSWNRSQESLAINVPTRPLADFLHQPIDFMKMDIEGAEESVLFAAGDRIKQVKQMILEFHPISQHSPSKLIEFLQQHRFKLSFIQKGKVLAAPPKRGLFYIEAKQR